MLVPSTRRSESGGEDCQPPPERPSRPGTPGTARRQAYCWQGTARHRAAGSAPAAVRTRLVWTPAALERLERVPSFVRGMVKRIYADWAQENGIAEFTPEVMDRARTELGLEGM